PMKIYSFDNLLFTSAKTSDDFVYKMLDTLLNNKDELVAVQPVLREFSAPFAYKQYEVGYHPGAVKYFNEHNVAPKALDRASALKLPPKPRPRRKPMPTRY